MEIIIEKDFMIIQVILVLFVVIAVWTTIVQYRSQSLDSGGFVRWMMLWVAVAIVILWPDLTSRVAHGVGIGRGVDLAIYSAILLLYYVLFRIVVRLEKLEQTISKLIRSSAIDEWKNKSK